MGIEGESIAPTSVTQRRKRAKKRDAKSPLEKTPCYIGLWASKDEEGSGSNEQLQCKCWPISGGFFGKFAQKGSKRRHANPLVITRYPTGLLAGKGKDSNSADMQCRNDRRRMNDEEVCRGRDEGGLNGQNQGGPFPPYIEADAILASLHPTAPPCEEGLI